MDSGFQDPKPAEMPLKQGKTHKWFHFHAPTGGGGLGAGSGKKSIVRNMILLATGINALEITMTAAFALTRLSSSIISHGNSH